MSVHLIDSPSCLTEKQICYDYWQYDAKIGYLNHIQNLCQKHALSHKEFFKAIHRYRAYISDVRCANCNSYCFVDVPADIPYMREYKIWFCESCIEFSCGELVSQK
ncbi:hypothetical protein [Psychrobacter sp.]|uniref:hypothetical protein n=1 Tax=Psychrobacter sp. TaxID=56811 RepID=UPI0025E3FA3A|nr:hypothetical protein [Psychrobacter sp.]